MLLGLATAVITVVTSFEGGSLGRVEQVNSRHLRCAVPGQADQNQRNRQASWYYFRLDNLEPGKELRIDLVDLVGEYNFRPGAHAVTRNTRPVFSYDDRTWAHFTDDDVSWNEKEVRLTLRFKPRQSKMWIAHMAPYTMRELNHLLSLGSRYLTTESIGKSVKGRDLMLLTVTDPGAPTAGKRVVWLMARQHAWEAGTSWAADGAVRFLLSDDAAAARIRRTTVFHILPVFDPDGVAAGAVRFNANGFDNNRNWDTATAERMPEISATRKRIFDSGEPIDLFLAMHNTESVDYVVGPAAYVELGKDLVSRLRKETTFYDPQSPRTSPDSSSIASGRMTVAEALFAQRNVPAFLMEMMVERHPMLGRQRTADDFSQFGRRLVSCLAASAAAHSRR